MGLQSTKLNNFLKGYRVHRARISDIKRGKKRREPCSRRLKKGEGKKEDFLLQNQKKRGSNYIHREIDSCTEILNLFCFFSCNDNSVPNSTCN